MDTPSGAPDTRVDDLVTRSSTLPYLHNRFLLTFTLGITLFGLSFAVAQENTEPKQAVIAPLASRSLVLDAVAVEGNLIAVGERGHILISSDGGQTWQQAEVPTRATLTGVYFHDRNLGWAVGHDSVILRTTDGGVTWELVNWAPEEEAPFFDVWFSDPDNGVALGAYGSYYTTSDGGSTWTFAAVGEDDWHLHQIARSPKGLFYIAGEAGTAYRSDDDGATWVALAPPYAGSFFGVLPLEENVVLLFGLRGHLLRSEDAGESWEEIETGTVAMLTSGITVDDGTVIIAGLGGTVLVSDDGGRSFQLHQQTDRRGISAIVESTDGSLLLVGEFGVKTTSLNELTTPSN